MPELWQRRIISLRTTEMGYRLIGERENNNLWLVSRKRPQRWTWQVGVSKMDMVGEAKCPVG